MPSSLIITVTSLNNVIDTVSTLWAVGLGNWGRSRLTEILIHSIQTGSGAASNGHWAFFFRALVLPGFETGYSFLSSTEINVWSCTFTPPYVFIAWWLIKQMEHVFSIYVTTLPNALELFRSICLIRHQPSSRFPWLWTARLSLHRNINREKWDHLTWVATVLHVLELNHLLRVLLGKPVAWIIKGHYSMWETVSYFLSVGMTYEMTCNKECVYWSWRVFASRSKNICGAFFECGG